MCEADAYIGKAGKDELLMEAVDLVELEEPDQWRLVNIFGEQKTVRARIRHLALGEHKLFFDAAE
jgi:predicted RNA-binding protein